jgi:hypothetical protein
MLTLLVVNPRNTVSQIINFSLGNMYLFSYVGSILICFHNGSSICIILCNICQPLHCVVEACENLSVFTHIVNAKLKCSINDSIKSKYPYIKCVNEDAECTLCSVKFCIACGGRSGVVNRVKKKQTKKEQAGCSEQSFQ